MSINLSNSSTTQWSYDQIKKELVSLVDEETGSKIQALNMPDDYAKLLELVTNASSGAIKGLKRFLTLTQGKDLREYKIKIALKAIQLQDKNLLALAKDVFPDSAKGFGERLLQSGRLEDILKEGSVEAFTLFASQVNEDTLACALSQTWQYRDAASRAKDPKMLRAVLEVLAKRGSTAIKKFLCWRENGNFVIDCIVRYQPETALRILKELRSLDLLTYLDLMRGLYVRRSYLCGYAASAGNFELFELLLDPENTHFPQYRHTYQSDWDSFPVERLDAVLIGGNMRCLNLALKLMGPRLLKEQLKRPLLHRAVESGNPAMITAMVNRYEKAGGQTLEEAMWPRESDGQTPLHLAAQHDNALLVNALLPLMDHTALQGSMDLAPQKTPLSALSHGARNGHFAFCKALLNGLRPEQQALILFEALPEAVKSSNEKLALYFLNHAEKLSSAGYYDTKTIPDSLVASLLQNAARNPSAAPLKLLLKLLEEDQIRKYLESEAEPSLLTLIANEGGPESLDQVLCYYRQEEIEAILLSNKDGAGLLYQARVRNKGDFARSFIPHIKQLSLEAQEALLRVPQDKLGHLDYCVKKAADYLPSLVKLLERMPEKILAEQVNGSTLLQAVWSDKPKVLGDIIPLLKRLSPTRRREVLKCCYGPNSHPLLQAIRHGNTRALELLSEALDLEDLDTLMYFWQRNAAETADQSILSGMLEAPKEVLQSLKPLMKRLGAKKRSQLLERAGDSVFEAALKNDSLSFLLEHFSKEDLRAKLKATSDIPTLIVDSLQGESQQFEQFMDLLPPEVREKALSPRHDGRSPLDDLVSTDKQNEALRLMKLMSDKQLALHLTPSARGPVFLSLLFVHDSVIVLKELARRLGKSTVLELTKESAVTPNLLCVLAANGKKSCREFVMSQLSKDDVESLLKPGRHATAPLHSALASNNSGSELPFWMDLYLKVGGETLKQAVEANYGGYLFEIAAMSAKPQIFEACKTLYTAIGADYRERVCLHSKSGSGPLFVAATLRRTESIDLLAAVAGKERLARELLSILEGITPISATISSPLFLMTSRDSTLEKLLKLCDQLNDWEFAKALGPTALTRLSLPIKDYLEKRYPDKEERSKTLIRNAALYPDRQKTGPVHHAYLSDFSSDTKKLLESNQFKPFLPTGLYEAFDTQGFPLADEFLTTDDDDRLDAIKQELGVLKFYHAQLTKIFVAQGGNKELVLTRFAPLLTRLSSYEDEQVITQLCQLLMEFPLAQTPSDASVLSWIPEDSKGPGLYLLALNVLERRGVHKLLLKKLHERIISSPNRTRESSPKGKDLLMALIALARTKKLSPAYIQQVIAMLCNENLPRYGSAVNQVIGLGQITKFRTTEMAGDGLEDLAFRCFRDLVPITETKDFAKRYQEKFSSKRRPNAIITYASRIASIAEVRQDLATWMDSVLRGDDKALRYSASNNPHLQALYKADPSLVKALPALVKGMKSFCVGAFSKSKGSSFPMNAQAIQNKVGTDKHLSEEDFPLIHDFLNTKTHSKSFVAASKQARKDSKSTVQAEQVRFYRFKLQQALISLYRKSQAYESASSGDKRVSLRNGLVKDLQAARGFCEQLAKLGKPVEQFAKDLEAAWTAHQESATTSVDDFDVSLTDNYLDLFLIGTDVNGSCQRVDASSITNRALLGYVMDGKNIPIVVRKPGSPVTVARRLLRIELDEASGKPALFLERLYSNYTHDAIGEAIMQMAKQVAKRLNLPLYQENDYENNTILVSKGSSATWVYSDAGGGVTRGEYAVRATLEYDPRKSSSNSSSSSSSSYK